MQQKNLSELFDRIERSGLAVNRLLIAHNDSIVGRFWRFPYRKDSKQLLFSLSKSFTSIAAGIALDNGFLDLNDRVVSFFPDRLPAVVSDHLEKMTVHHLLSMNTGQHDHFYPTIVTEKDWVKAFLAQEVRYEPGSYYLYNTHATYLISAILEKATGQRLIDFLKPRLFEPLDISEPDWETCPSGIAAGGMGLSIPAEGVVRFGQMLMNNGEFEGRRIVSEAYIRMAVREQSDNRKGEQRIDFAQGYGYQFFRCRHGCFMGNGGFGQLCFVAPNERIVVAAACSFPNMKPLQTLLDLLNEYVLDPIRTGDLQWGYGLPMEKYIDHSATIIGSDDVPDLHNREYVMRDNRHGILKVRFQRDSGGSSLLHMSFTDMERNYRFDFEKSVCEMDLFRKDLALHRQEVVTQAHWLDPHTFRLTLTYIESPYVVVYTFEFMEQSVKLHRQMNGSTNPDHDVIMGTLRE